MASANRIGSALVATLCTAVLVYFGTGLHPWWPFMWLAPLPVLVFSTRSSARATALVAFFSWTLGGLNLFHYFNAVLGVPKSVQVVIYCGPALLFMLSVLLFRALLRRAACWSAVAAFAGTWVTGEYLSNLVSVHGTAGSISYSQLEFLPFLQFASVTGPWGISFFLLLPSAALAALFAAWKTDSKTSIRVLVTAWGAVALVLIFGAIRLYLHAPLQQVKVGLVASDAHGNTGVLPSGAETQRLLSDYAVQAEALAARGAQVIVLPEKLGVMVEGKSMDTNALLQSLADRTKSTVVVGVVDVSGPMEYNQALVYRPARPVLTYNKHHMLPPFESQFVAGTSTTVWPQDSAIWGVTICKDMDFTQLSRQYGKSSAGLMLVPAWDFDIDRVEHGHMALMRAVESGFNIVRAAKQGYLTVADNRGRVLAETQSDSAPFATLIAEVPVSHEQTFYLFAGDWFGWLAAVIALLSCGQLYRLRGPDAHATVVRMPALHSVK